MTVGVLSTLVLFWVATAWLQRSEREVVEFESAGSYRFRSAAGPIDVTDGDRPLLRYEASWLLSGPALAVEPVDGGPPDDVAGPSSITVSCPGAFPCRAASRLEFPPGSRVDVGSSGGDVSVVGFVGDLTIEADGRSEVFLGPLAGSLTVATETGGVFGFGLNADDVEIGTTGGEIELRFATRPRRVVIRSGSEPVTLELPDGDYAVNVKGGSSITIGVGRLAGADSEILVQAGGPVRIQPRTDENP